MVIMSLEGFKNRVNDFVITVIDKPNEEVESNFSAITKQFIITTIVVEVTVQQAAKMLLDSN